MRFIVAQGFCCGYDFSDVGLPAVIGVEVEESVEVFDLAELEAGVLGDDGLREDFFPLLFDNGLAVNRTHGYIESNII